MIKAVIFDFDGVFCHDRFYEEMLLPQHQELYSWIQDNIFGNNDLFYQWMRNEINTGDINKIIAKGTGHKEEFLNDVLLKSLQGIRLDEKMFGLAKELKKFHNKKIAIITDNMDVFSTVVVKQHKLNEIFDSVINSADHGCLKAEQNGKLFEVALEILNEKIENCLFVDDSLRKVEAFKEKGGQGFLYSNNFEELSELLKLS
ncbi:MAG: HAD family hydrolase [Patescibacteria group bacterium]